MAFEASLSMPGPMAVPSRSQAPWPPACGVKVLDLSVRKSEVPNVSWIHVGSLESGPRFCPWPPQALPRARSCRQCLTCKQIGEEGETGLDSLRV